MPKNRQQPPGLHDTFQRRIDYLRISITDRCNLNCVYCAPERVKKHIPAEDLLSVREIGRFVRVAMRHGLMKVRLTGGEPLLRADLAEIIAEVKDAGVPDVSLTTNGMLLADKANELKRAGLDRVNISLDTLQPARYAEMTGGGNIQRVWQAIAQAEAEGLRPIKINAVPIRDINHDEVAAFAALTLDRDFHVRFIEYMPVGRKNICLKGVCVTKDELLENITAKLGELGKLPFNGKGPSRNYRLKGAKGIIGIISPVSDHFCDHCNRLRLTPQGTIKPCLLSNITVDLRGPLREGLSDEGLDALFINAVSVKPKGHSLGSSGNFDGLASMSEIGG